MSNDPHNTSLLQTHGIEDYYNKVYEEGPLGIALVDVDFHILHANEPLLQMFGYSLEELVARTFVDITHPEDIEAHVAVAGRGFKGEIQRYTLEKRYIRRDGSVFWGRLSASMVRDEDGAQIYILGMLENISERMETDLARRESEARFQMVADHAPVMIVMSDAEGNHRFVNRAWREFHGVETDRPTGHSWVKLIHPVDRDEVVKTMFGAFEARIPVRIEYRLRRADDLYRHVLDTATPLFDGNGQFYGYIISCLDITEQNRLREQLFDAQKMESLGRLAGGIAHDFNNLLTAIFGYTELAMLATPDDLKTQSLLQNVLTASEKAASLTKQLLAYARSQRVEFSNVDVNSSLLEMNLLLRRTISAKCELVTLLSSDECVARVNPSQLEQIILNLVVNACDAMPDGGSIVIETKSRRVESYDATRNDDIKPGDYVELIVTDTGIGMTAEVRERIFEPFYTTKENAKGAGLGLATTFGIVKQSGGLIEVTTAQGRGSSFHVFLPAGQQLEPAEKRENSMLPVEETPNHDAASILLVDDEPMVRDLAAQFLRAAGFQVLEAANGPEALELQERWQGEIDLLVSDVVMPLMGGKELARRLIQARPGVRCLFMSGYNQDDALQLGAYSMGVSLIAKPFSASLLISKVREILKVVSTSVD